MEIYVLYSYCHNNEHFLVFYLNDLGACILYYRIWFVKFWCYTAAWLYQKLNICVKRKVMSVAVISINKTDFDSCSNMIGFPGHIWSLSVSLLLYLMSTSPASYS